MRKIFNTYTYYDLHENCILLEYEFGNINMGNRIIKILWSYALVLEISLELNTNLSSILRYNMDAS